MATSPLLRWFTLALVLLFVGLSVKHTFKAHAKRTAFSRWQPQVLELEQGVDIAARHNYPNPPVMAVLLEPLARLPEVPAALLWFYLKVGMALLAIRWTFRLVEDVGRPFPPLAQVGAVLLSLKPVLEDLDHGNINLFILFLVVAALTAFRRRWDVLAGALLGLAIACKLTPALFVPYLVWKRAWRALAGVAAGLALFLYPGLVPSLRLGFEDNQRQLASWYRGMVHPFLVEGKVTSEHNNQSLPGLVARLATHQPSFSRFVENVYTPTRYDNLLELGPTQARVLVQACAAAFALLVVGACRAPTAPRQGWRLAAEYGLVVLGMLLFSERTWKHHCVTLLVPFSVVCYYLAVCRPGPALRAYLLGSLALAALLMLATSIGPSRDGLADAALARSLGKQAQVYGAYLFACLLLTVALAVVLRSAPREERAPARAAPPLAA
jgi:hypothetical protein